MLPFFTVAVASFVMVSVALPALVLVRVLPPRSSVMFLLMTTSSVASASRVTVWPSCAALMASVRDWYLESPTEATASASICACVTLEPAMIRTLDRSPVT